MAAETKLAYALLLILFYMGLLLMFFYIVFAGESSRQQRWDEDTPEPEPSTYLYDRFSTTFDTSPRHYLEYQTSDNTVDNEFDLTENMFNIYSLDTHNYLSVDFGESDINNTPVAANFHCMPITGTKVGFHNVRQYGMEDYPKYLRGWSLNIVRPGQYMICSYLWPQMILSTKDPSMIQLERSILYQQTVPSSNVFEVVKYGHKVFAIRNPATGLYLQESLTWSTKKTNFAFIIGSPGATNYFPPKISITRLSQMQAEACDNIASYVSSGDGTNETSPLTVRTPIYFEKLDVQNNEFKELYPAKNNPVAASVSTAIAATAMVSNPLTALLFVMPFVLITTLGLASWKARDFEPGDIVATPTKKPFYVLIKENGYEYDGKWMYIPYTITHGNTSLIIQSEMFANDDNKLGCQGLTFQNFEVYFRQWLTATNDFETTLNSTANWRCSNDTTVKTAIKSYESVANKFTSKVGMFYISRGFSFSHVGATNQNPKYVDYAYANYLYNSKFKVEDVDNVYGYVELGESPDYTFDAAGDLDQNKLEPTHSKQTKFGLWDATFSDTTAKSSYPVRKVLKNELLQLVPAAIRNQTINSLTYAPPPNMFNDKNPFFDINVYSNFFVTTPSKESFQGNTTVLGVGSGGTVGKPSRKSVMTNWYRLWYHGNNNTEFTLFPITYGEPSNGNTGSKNRSLLFTFT